MTHLQITIAQQPDGDYIVQSVSNEGVDLHRTASLELAACFVNTAMQLLIAKKEQPVEPQLLLPVHLDDRPRPE